MVLTATSRPELDSAAQLDIGLDFISLLQAKAGCVRARFHGGIWMYLLKRCIFTVFTHATLQHHTKRVPDGPIGCRTPQQ